MLRIMILATLLFLASATSVRAGSASDVHDRREQLRIGAQIGGAQIGGAQVGGAQVGGAQVGGAQVGGALAFVRSGVRASLPFGAMHRTINGPPIHRGPRQQGSMMALFELDGEKRAVAVPLTDSVSLGVAYQYLRQEDLRLEVAETAGLDDGYSTHNVVLRARWRF